MPLPARTCAARKLICRAPPIRSQRTTNQKESPDTPSALKQRRALLRRSLSCRIGRELRPRLPIGREASLEGAEPLRCGWVFATRSGDRSDLHRSNIPWTGLPTEGSWRIRNFGEFSPSSCKSPNCGKGRLSSLKSFKGDRTARSHAGARERAVDTQPTARSAYQMTYG